MAGTLFHQQFDSLCHITIEVRLKIEAMAIAINVCSQKQGKNLLILKIQQGFKTKGISYAVQVKGLVITVGSVLLAHLAPPTKIARDAIQYL